MDEAGYGPTLGPLVVTGIAFRIPEPSSDKCFWQLLRASCTKKPISRDRRLIIADSKQLTRRKTLRSMDGSTKGSSMDGDDTKKRQDLSKLSQLERAALVMLAVQNQSPHNFTELLQTVAPAALTDRSQYPWYANWNPDLPLAVQNSDLATCANAVRLDCSANQIDLAGVFCEIVPEAHFNALVKRTRNKATLLQGVGLRILDRIIRLAKDENVRIVADRLGGRTHYRDAVNMLLPGYELQILEESDTRSAYRSRFKNRTVDIEFLVKGESSHLPVALASIYSKYLRELFIQAFNDYWSRHIQGIKPTAGYYADAQRWLADAGPTLTRHRIDPDTLIRLC